MAALTVLDRSLYTTSEAARLLELSPVTLRRWLEGFAVRGVKYPSVIRMEPTGSSEVTWAEFVEAGYLREYRRFRGVSLQRLRRFIDLAREAWGVAYPLAHFKPIVGPERALLVLLKRLQDEAGLEEELQPVHLLAPDTGQLVMTGPFRAFREKVQFDADGVADRIHPLGADVPVLIDPSVSFGVPQVHGIRTEVVAEAIATGEQEEDVAKEYDLALDDVRAAIRWELKLRPRAEAA